MSGHSKWATIKHKKAAVDKARGKTFAKLARQLEVAAREGGGDPSSNASLRTVVLKAKAAQMTNDAIDRAIKRGAGLEAGGASYETIMYEGYGPAGVAIMIECLSDNRNRAASDVRVAVTRNGGNMADPGSVAYLFNRKGVVTVSKSSGVTEDALMEATLEAGAQDIKDLGETFEIISEPSDLVAVRSALQGAKIDYDSAESSFLPSMSIPVSDPSTAKKIFDLIDAIEDLDDVQNVYGNFEVSDAVMEQAASL